MVAYVAFTNCLNSSTEKATVLISQIFLGKETVNDMRTVAKFEPVSSVPEFGPHNGLNTRLNKTAER